MGAATTQYLVDPLAGLPQVLSEYGPNNATTHYLPGIAQKQGATWSYFGTDGIGSTRFMFNSARTMTYAANYDPYGQVMAQYLPDATPSFGFTGQMTDPSGLQYLRARYYDPSLGTFLSQDPVQGVPGGASIRWNPYIYAGGNPTSLIDPTGLCPEWGLGKSVCEFLSDTLSAGFDIPREAFDDKGLDEVAQLALYTGLYAGSQLPSLITDRSGGYTRTENLENARAFFEEVGVAIIYEPMDYAQSGMALLRGELSTLEAVFLFVPGLSAGLLRRVDDVGDAGRQVNRASDVRYVDDVAGGSGRVRTAARRGSADGGRSLAMRRAWFADGGKRDPRIIKWAMSPNAEIRSVNPLEILYSQKGASKRFRDRRSVFDLRDDLVSGALHPSDLPIIHVVEWEGQLWTLDHRRLWAIRDAGNWRAKGHFTSIDVIVEDINYREVASDFRRKLDLRDDYTSITLRGREIDPRRRG